MNATKEIVELLKKAHEPRGQLISDNRMWKVTYGTSSNTIIDHFESGLYRPVGYYNNELKTAGSYPFFKKFEENIVNAFWLANGEIALSQEQYIKGYASVLPSIITFTNKVIVDFSQTELLVKETRTDGLDIIHTFTMQGGEEYFMFNREAMFRYRIKFLHVIHSEAKHCYKYYHRDIISPFQIEDIINRTDFVQIMISGDSYKEDITAKFQKRSLI